MAMRMKSTVATLATLITLIAAESAIAQPAPRLGVAQSVDGVSISYEIHGDKGPTVLFVHGWTCDRTYWARQVPFFATRGRVVTVDLAGHGESGQNRTDWSIRQFANDVIAVLEAENLDGVVLVGHSLGGPVILEAAIMAPERVIASVGVDTFADAWLRAPFTSALGSMEADFAGFVRRTARGMFTAESDPDLVGRISEDMASHPAVSGIASIRALNEWGRDRYATALAEFAKPLGIIQSTFNAYMAVEQHQSRLPMLEIVQLDGVGHFSMLEAPDRFNDSLSRLVERLTSR
jgi:pimeloyl-ACP methyl ester carboxylesterase